MLASPTPRVAFHAVGTVLGRDAEAPVLLSAGHPGRGLVGREHADQCPEVLYELVGHLKEVIVGSRSGVVEYVSC